MLWPYKKKLETWCGSSKDSKFWRWYWICFEAEIAFHLVRDDDDPCPGSSMIAACHPLSTNHCARSNTDAEEPRQPCMNTMSGAVCFCWKSCTCVVFVSNWRWWEIHSSDWKDCLGEPGDMNRALTRNSRYALKKQNAITHDQKRLESTMKALIRHRPDRNVADNQANIRSHFVEKTIKSLWMIIQFSLLPFLQLLS